MHTHTHPCLRIDRLCELPGVGVDSSDVVQCTGLCIWKFTVDHQGVTHTHTPIENLLQSDSTGSPELLPSSAGCQVQSSPVGCQVQTLLEVTQGLVRPAQVQVGGAYAGVQVGEHLWPVGQCVFWPCLHHPQCSPSLPQTALHVPRGRRYPDKQQQQQLL